MTSEKAHYMYVEQFNSHIFVQSHRETPNTEISLVGLIVLIYIHYKLRHV